MTASAHTATAAHPCADASGVPAATAGPSTAASADASRTAAASASAVDAPSVDVQTASLDAAVRDELSALLVNLVQDA